MLVRFGRVHPESASAYDIPTDTLYFEVEYETLLTLAKDSEKTFHPISKYQKIERELNFVMDEDVRTGDIASIL